MRVLCTVVRVLCTVDLVSPRSEGSTSPECSNHVETSTCKQCLSILVRVLLALRVSNHVETSKQCLSILVRVLLALRVSNHVETSKQCLAGGNQ